MCADMHVVYLEPSRTKECFLVRDRTDTQRKNVFRNVGIPNNYPGTVVFPPSPQLNYFEIKIITKRSSNDCPEVGIGVGPSTYNLTSLPGWGKGSVGYHSDDGKVYHSYPYSQRLLGPTCAVGDVMGCGVVFEDLEGHAMVWFTKNGSVVGRPERVALLPEGLCSMFGSRHGGEEVLYLGHRQWTPTDLEWQAVVHPLKTCQATKHRFDEGQCRICTVCGLCTGYGPLCRRNSFDDRTPGMPCLCGAGDAGCFWCGACRVCSNVELPPEHPLQQHQTWNYGSARERVRKLFTTSYKGRLPLTGQGHPQQVALVQALQQLRQAVSDCESRTADFKLGTVKVQFPYDATQPDELSTRPGDLVVQEEEQKDSNEWLKGTLNGKTGLFYKPFTCKPMMSVQSAHPLERGDPQGYKATFLNKDYVLLEKPDEWLECTVCQQLSNKPHQIPCCGGQTICEKCAEEWKKRSNNCPLCRKSPFETTPDVRGERFINNLQTYCPKYAHGCDWKGDLKSVKEHVTAACEWFVMQCECRLSMPRKCVDTHKQKWCIDRWVHCPCCGEGGTYANIVLEHYHSCPNWPERCPNQCQGGGVSLTRGTVEDHCNSECPEQVVACKFACLGCNERGKRREIPSHMQADTTAHLDLLMAEYTSVVPLLVKENEALKQRIQQLEQHLSGKAP